MYKKMISFAVVAVLSLVPVSWGTSESNGMVGVSEASACAGGTCKDKVDHTCYISEGPWLIKQENSCDLNDAGC